jgi:ribosomal protein S18 acetylase RimI-like enzyme
MYMAKHYYFIRFLEYIKKRGILNSIGHTFYIIKRDFFQRKQILYFTDLTEMKDESIILPQGYAIELIKNMKELSGEHVSEYIRHHSIGDKVKEKMERRFQKGSWLWCMTYHSKLVGFVWTKRNTPFKLYFFPMTDKDVHFFNNEVFSEYRGRGINTILINSVMFYLKQMGLLRCYIETGTWNKPEQRSLAKTYFAEIGIVSTFKVFKRHYTVWYKMK